MHLVGPIFTITKASIVWAAVALVVQVVRARGAGRKDYSVKAGSVMGGIIYNFTQGMMPKHKETISRHWFHFGMGVVMHLGIFAGIIRVLFYVYNPWGDYGVSIILTEFAAAGVVCAFYLFVKRIASKEMRAISCLDDYISILLVLDFLVMTVAREFWWISFEGFLLHASVLFVYLPLGKLRHAVFFFVARAEFGGRLGYRGTYPVK